MKTESLYIIYQHQGRIRPNVGPPKPRLCRAAHTRVVLGFPSTGCFYPYAAYTKITILCALLQGRIAPSPLKFWNIEDIACQNSRFAWHTWCWASSEPCPLPIGWLGEPLVRSSLWALFYSSLAFRQCQQFQYLFPRSQQCWVYHLVHYLQPHGDRVHWSKNIIHGIRLSESQWQAWRFQTKSAIASTE